MIVELDRQGLLPQTDMRVLILINTKWFAAAASTVIALPGGHGRYTRQPQLP